MHSIVPPVRGTRVLFPNDARVHDYVLSANPVHVESCKNRHRIWTSQTTRAGVAKMLQ